MNGMRTDLPATPKVGSVEAQELDVGQPVRLPTGTAKTGTPLSRSRGRGLHRRLPLVPVAVGGQHDPAQVLDSLRSTRPAARSGRCLPGPRLGRTAGRPRSSARRSFSQVDGSARGAIASRRVTGAAAPDSTRRPRRRACPCWPKRPRARRSPAFPPDGIPRSTPAG